MGFLCVLLFSVLDYLHLSHSSKKFLGTTKESPTRSYALDTKSGMHFSTQEKESMDEVIAGVSSYYTNGVKNKNKNKKQDKTDEKPSWKQGKNKGKKLDKKQKQHEHKAPSWKAFNHSNPHKEWCPAAKCFNSPICAPCDRRFLFIVASPRSGSTTLLHMLSALPNVRLSGENFNELYYTSKLTTNLKNKKFESSETMKKGSFMGGTIEEGAFMHNAIPIGSMACVAQTLVETLNPPKMTAAENKQPFDASEEAGRILGMKLVRISKAEWTPQEAAEFFQESFPCSRVLVNFRSNSKNQIRSIVDSFGLKDEKARLEKLEKENKFLASFAETLGEERAKLINMSEWKDDIQILNSVLKWMGFEGCEFSSLVHENHHGYARDRTKVDVGESCTNPH
jgi:hypothetical protein